jgi:hypothetical protein
MKRNNFIRIAFVCLLLLPIVFASCSSENLENDNSERTKVALRAVGNELLLSNGDSTSVVLPVMALEDNSYEISFENPLAFDPTALNHAMSETFDRAGLSKTYLVEVLQCSDGEVAYSYEIRRNKENNLIPCGGRLVPENCYTIQVHFSNQKIAAATSIWFYILVFLVIAFLAFVFFSRYVAWNRGKRTDEAMILGRFRFFPEQNVLLKEAEEITLSRKECELLTIFVAHPNQVVKREDLTKKVWEDNGVIVGRSLDTYISKLRKKLQDDDTIKITNIHGVGYKLEISVPA